MIKKSIPAALVIFLLILTMCSCDNSHGKAEEITEVKVAEDSEGNSFSVIADGDGFFKLGDKSNLVITVDDGKGKPGKNADGEFVTRVVDFPGTLRAGNEIYTKFLRITLPENWKNESDSIVKLSCKKDGKKVTLTINERSGMSVKECQAEIEDMLTILGDIEQEKVSLDFAEAVKLTCQNKIAVYIFNAEGRTYYVKINADEKLFEEINFEEIINTIKFRKGE